MCGKIVTGERFSTMKPRCCNTCSLALSCWNMKDFALKPVYTFLLLSYHQRCTPVNWLLITSWMVPLLFSSTFDLSDHTTLFHFASVSVNEIRSYFHMYKEEEKINICNKTCFSVTCSKFHQVIQMSFDYFLWILMVYITIFKTGT